MFFLFVCFVSFLKIRRAFNLKIRLHFATLCPHGIMLLLNDFQICFFDFLKNFFAQSFYYFKGMLLPNQYVHMFSYISILFR